MNTGWSMPRSSVRTWRLWLDYAVRDAIATHRIAAQMLRRAMELQPEPADLLPEARDRFGLLSEAVQVRAAIALAAVERCGIHLDIEQLEAVRAAFLADVKCLGGAFEAAAPVADEGLFDDRLSLLKRDKEGNVKITATGAPSLHQKRFMTVLAAIGEQVGIEIPTTDTGRLTLSMEFWDQHRDKHPLIGAFGDLVNRAAGGRILNQLRHPHEHPRYGVMVITGRTSCSRPNVQQVPKRGGLRELFIPSEGHVFLGIDYSAIELVTLARVCLHRYGESRLAEVLRDGQDPHALTAASMCGMKARKFLAMKKSNPKEYNRLRAAAKAVNFGVPGGLGPDGLIDYARNVFGVVMTREDAERFRNALIDDTYPELRRYLREDADRVHVLTGRVRADVHYTEGKNTPFSGLAADGAKQAMFNLTAAGFHLVAFIHDEFLMELPEDDDHTARAVEIERICIDAMQTVVGDLPVKCEYALMRRWSKDAEAVRDKDGRLLVWEPTT
jgi:hypothetical protein